MTEEKWDDSKAEQFLKQYLAGSDDELGIEEYALGKLYLSQDRIDEAEQLFIKSAEKGNAYSAFSLGRIYMTEENSSDDSKAEQFLKQYLGRMTEEKDDFLMMSLVLASMLLASSISLRIVLTKQNSFLFHPPKKKICMPHINLESCILQIESLTTQKL